MTGTISTHRVFSLALGFFEHAAAIVLGFVFIVVGLGLGVTMIMLPVGIVVGLIGVAMVVGGFFARVGGDE